MPHGKRLHRIFTHYPQNGASLVAYLGFFGALGTPFPDINFELEKHYYPVLNFLFIWLSNLKCVNEETFFLKI